jgi:protein ImuA
MAESGMPERVRARVGVVEHGEGTFGRGAASLGAPALDAALPWGGLPFGALHEVSGLAATGATAAFARRFLRRGGMLVWCRDAELTPELGELDRAGLARFGLTPERMTVVRARGRAEVMAAFEEALRRRGVVCAVVEIACLSLATSRRLRVAAEAGGGAGLVLRPEASPLPNAALTRWCAEPGAGGGVSWRLTLRHAQGGVPGFWTVRWDEQALSFASAARTADGARTVRGAPSAWRAVPAG